MISRDDLLAICPRPKTGARAAIWDGYAEAMLSPAGIKLFANYGMLTPARMAMFLGAVVAPETGMTVFRESGSYTADRILAIFGAGRHSSAITPAEAARIAGLSINPDGSGPRAMALFERAYGLDIAHCCGTPKHCTKLKPRRVPCQARDLGNWKIGDGYLCRGLGLNQSTGRYAQEKGAAEIGCTVEELATPINALHLALIEWDEKDLNRWADAGGETGVINVRKLINAGSLNVSVRRVNGIPDALRAYRVALRVITSADFATPVASEAPAEALAADAAGVDRLPGPPASMMASTEAHASSATGIAGVSQLYLSIKAAVQSSAQNGQIAFADVGTSLLADERFWLGAGLVFTGSYMLSKRIYRHYVKGD